MTTKEPEQIEQLRRIFKALNKAMLAMWRLGFGKWINIWPTVFGRVMVLGHIGRKTGIRRRTPLNFTRIGEMIYCISGFGGISDWYRNIQQSREVEIWLPERTFTGTIEEVVDQENWLELLRKVLVASGFAAYLVGIDPRHDPDDLLREKTQGYRLLRIDRLEPCSGPKDRFWMWFVIMVSILAIRVLPRRRLACEEV